jgi:hypothetical protein
MTKRVKFNRFFYSFPIQLLLVLVKRNLVLLMYWVILFSFITGGILNKFGVTYLFLDPEYRGDVDFISFFIVGASVGAFIMVYNVSSYISNGYRFPFIATLSRPFQKFTINNFIVPVLFIFVYLYRIIDFQLYTEFKPVSDVITIVAGFISGITVVCLFTMTYFFRTNKDIIRMYGVEASDTDPNSPIASHIHSASGEAKKVAAQFRRRRYWRVDTYLSGITKIKLVRKTEHYKREMLESVFRQNHLNATLVELIIFSGFILIGLFKDYEYFKIPAGSSVIFLFAMIIMLSSALRFWLGTWTTSVFLVTILSLNILSGFGIFYTLNKAHGLKYSQKISAYNLAEINKPVDKVKLESDINHTQQILEKWKAKNTVVGHKPKMIVFCTSGGGSRASMFTFRVMQVADQVTNGRFMQSTHLISGASGGLIGASYYREIYLKDSVQLLRNYYGENMIHNTAKDLLNPVFFSITVSDLFLNIRRFEDVGEEYLKDRGYSFEKQLNQNLDNAFDKTLGYYTKPEANADIPMIITSPSIVNDGRRLVISSQPASYLTHDISTSSQFRFSSSNDAIEFTDFFKEQGALNTKFSSIIRMNATFPYILPAVGLPTEPVIKVMDAGLRDNFGTKNALRFLYVFRNWIKENTSGVIMIQVRDTRKYKEIEKNDKSFFEHFTTPLSNVYGNLLTIQDYNEDESIEYASAWLGTPFDYLSFELPTYEEDISLSWHLTTKEKKIIYNAANLDYNKRNFEKLKQLLSTTN